MIHRQAKPIPSPDNPVPSAPLPSEWQMLLRGVARLQLQPLRSAITLTRLHQSARGADIVCHAATGRAGRP